MGLNILQEDGVGGVLQRVMVTDKNALEMEAII